MRISHQFSTLNPALQREIIRRSASKNVVSPRRAKITRNFSTSALLPKQYSFHIGTSWAGKVDRDGYNRFKIPFSAHTTIGSWRDQMLSRPKAVKSVDAGEDFFFVQEMRNGSGVAFGVADGVGGWVESGVDPSLFSQALMYHAHRYSRSAWAGEPEVDPTLDYEEREQIEGWEMTPYECLGLSYDGVLREKAVQAGSSTACIITLNAANGLLRSANLGDSGFSIIRSSSVFHRQRTQTHFFNCPKQLTKLPANSGRKFSRAGGIHRWILR
ncbi:hypothetical protein Agabi119p4_3076 [Agaricus bisporus var. burnettii]|uniref:Protein phosphatase n=1 Tax=Agaricus bisporus var. burnettii TaxID=192524 RepID=A0A8H7KJ16_AGABI|nr:hypothetical protein Agabi119p4_3076 [Agaricus bisporus var. burnettii]